MSTLLAIDMRRLSTTTLFTLLGVLALAACSDDAGTCKAPGVEIAITFGADVATAEITRLRASAILDGAKARSRDLTAGEVGLDSGQNRFAILFDGKTITASHSFDLSLEAFDKQNKLLASGRMTAPVQVLAGAACAQATITLVKGGGGATVIDLATAAPDLKLVAQDHAPGAVVTCDFDGDGTDDIAIAVPTAPGLFAAQENHGQVYLLLGPKHGALGTESTVELAQANVAMKIVGASAGQLLGEALVCRDLNADGKADLLVGAPESDGGAGKVFVFFGQTTPRAVVDLSKDAADIVIAGQPGDRLGTALAVAAGQVSGAYGSLVLGAPGYAGPDGTRSKAGGVFLVRGRASWAATVDLATDADTVTVVGLAGEGFGSTVAAGNLHDSSAAADDIVAAAIDGGDSGCAGCGIVRAFRKETLATTQLVDCEKDEPSLAVVGPKAGAKFGASLTVGDHNADGVGDVIVGAPNDDKLYVVFGKGTLLAQAGQPAKSQSIATLFNAVYAGETGSQFGLAVLALPQGAAGSAVDLLIGAPEGSSGKGLVYRYQGRAGFKPQEAIPQSGSPYLLKTVVGAKAGDRLGTSLAGGRLSSGDDKQDLLLSAPTARTLYGIFYR